jgi:hypothetical protein
MQNFSILFSQLALQLFLSLTVSELSFSSCKFTNFSNSLGEAAGIFTILLFGNFTLIFDQPSLKAHTGQDNFAFSMVKPL